MSMKSMNHLSSILNDNRLTRPNFSDWLRDLNIVLNMETLGYILETQHENMKSAREVLKNLRELYEENNRIAQYEISKELFRERMQEGTKVGAHVQKMIRQI
ncbi:uncharacterized protein LOC116206223 [Punica granatum]|uniref:Uncharacterized protein LOC116206223 n=1 Tax=Punica granatum TaxID=22663 RepID=A0A6P8DEA6_PUNGR|nr:uncharacterized protein LOC116206223 [Punica granatum]